MKTHAAEGSHWSDVVVSTIPSRKKLFRKLTCCCLSIIFSLHMILPAGVSAQMVSSVILPPPGTMVTPAGVYEPPLLKGLTLHADNPFEFDFIFSRGEETQDPEALQAEAGRMVRYFMAALTVPEKDMWVNLNPQEQDRIIPGTFSVTEMGRDLLAQDYLLKQMSASLLHPEEKAGSSFWEEVYRTAYEKFGTTQIPVNTFNKVWVMADEATVYQHGTSALVVNSRLKVLTEEDLRSLDANLPALQGGSAANTELNEVSAAAVRQAILPVLEREVNEGKTFARLRQVYHAFILASWFKQTLKDSLVAQVYANRSKVGGIDMVEDGWKDKVFEQYLAAYRKGVVNLIREDHDPATRQVVPRKYFSGGIHLASSAVGNSTGSRGTTSLAASASPLKVLTRMTAAVVNFIRKTPLFGLNASLVARDGRQDGISQLSERITSFFSRQQNSLPLGVDHVAPVSGISRLLGALDTKQLSFAAFPSLRTNRILPLAMTAIVCVGCATTGNYVDEGAPSLSASQTISLSGLYADRTYGARAYYSLFREVTVPAGTEVVFRYEGAQGVEDLLAEIIFEFSPGRYRFVHRERLPNAPSSGEIRFVLPEASVNKAALQAGTYAENKKLGGSPDATIRSVTVTFYPPNAPPLTIILNQQATGFPVADTQGEQQNPIVTIQSNPQQSPQASSSLSDDEVAQLTESFITQNPTLYGEVAINRDFVNSRNDDTARLNENFTELVDKLLERSIQIFLQKQEKVSKEQHASVRQRIRQNVQWSLIQDGETLTRDNDYVYPIKVSLLSSENSKSRLSTADGGADFVQEYAKGVVEWAGPTIVGGSPFKKPEIRTQENLEEWISRYLNTKERHSAADGTDATNQLVKAIAARITIDKSTGTLSLKSQASSAINKTEISMMVDDFIMWNENAHHEIVYYQRAEGVDVEVDLIADEEGEYFDDEGTPVTSIDEEPALIEHHIRGLFDTFFQHRKEAYSRFSPARRKIEKAMLESLSWQIIDRDVDRSPEYNLDSTLGLKVYLSFKITSLPPTRIVKKNKQSPQASSVLNEPVSTDTVRALAAEFIEEFGRGGIRVEFVKMDLELTEQARNVLGDKIDDFLTHYGTSHEVNAAHKQLLTQLNQAELTELIERIRGGIDFTIDGSQEVDVAVPGERVELTLQLQLKDAQANSEIGVGAGQDRFNTATLLKLVDDFLLQHIERGVSFATDEVGDINDIIERHLKTEVAEHIREHLISKRETRYPMGENLDRLAEDMQALVSWNIDGSPKIVEKTYQDNPISKRITVNYVISYNDQFFALQQQERQRLNAESSSALEFREARDVARNFVNWTGEIHVNLSSENALERGIEAGFPATNLQEAAERRLKEELAQFIQIQQRNNRKATVESGIQEILDHITMRSESGDPMQVDDGYFKLEMKDANKVRALQEQRQGSNMASSDIGKMGEKGQTHGGVLLDPAYLRLEVQGADGPAASSPMLDLPPLNPADFPQLQDAVFQGFGLQVNYLIPNISLPMWLGLNTEDLPEEGPGQDMDLAVLREEQA